MSVVDTMLGMKTIAVVGLSPKPERASNDVSRYLMAQGYTIIPVNPGHEEILGLKCYPSLKDIPAPVDIVQVFRKAELTPPIAREAVEIGAKGLWLQLGISNKEAAEIAKAGSLHVVMDKCMKIEHGRSGI